MFTTFMSLVLFNTFLIRGHQGFCYFVFWANQGGYEVLSDVEITVVPVYSPKATLDPGMKDPAVLKFDSIGGAESNDEKTADLYTGCKAKAFVITSAKATSDQRGPVDLLAEKRIEIGTYQPRRVTIKQPE